MEMPPARIERAHARRRRLRCRQGGGLPRPPERRPEPTLRRLGLITLRFVRRLPGDADELSELRCAGQSLLPCNADARCIRLQVVRARFEVGCLERRQYVLE